MSAIDFINKDFIYAVVGANNDPARYGYIILKNLTEKGYKVVGVNPKYKDIDSIKCFENLQSIQPKPDVVVLVVPPTTSLEILNDVVEVGLKKVWMQPGTFNDRVIAKAKTLGLEIIADGSCIMVVSVFVK